MSTTAVVFLVVSAVVNVALLGLAVAYRDLLYPLVFSPAECRRRLEMRLVRRQKEVEHLEERIADYRRKEAPVAPAGATP